MKRMLIVGLIAVAACKVPKKDDAPAVTVGIRELLKDYKDNEVRADTKYKGKRLQVTGVVGDIKKNIANSIYVTLSATGGPLDLQSAHCSFGDQYLQQASDLSKGTSITVDCRCDGLVLMSVVMNDCTFVGTPAAASTTASSAPATTGPAISAGDVCKKLETVGVAKNCSSSDPEKVQFDVATMAGHKGMVVHLADETKFKGYVTSVEASPSLRPFFPSTKAHIVVHLLRGASPDIEARVKLVVDTL